MNPRVPPRALISVGRTFSSLDVDRRTNERTRLRSSINWWVRVTSDRFWSGSYASRNRWPRSLGQLVADGLHARTDGFTSLAVLVGVGGVALGWDWADPVVGLVITAAILAVLWQAAREICRRLMDAVDPALVDQTEQTLRATLGVRPATPRCPS